MFCTKCGAKLADDAVFCTSCGEKLKSKTDEAVKEDTKAEETVKEESKTEESAKEEPKAEDSAKAEESVKEEAKAEDSAKAEEPAKEESKAEDSAKTEETAKEEPKAEEPVKEEPVAQEPVASGVSPLDAPKKGGAKGLIIIGAAVVAVAVVALVLYLAVFKSMIGFNKFEKALKANNYKDAKKIAKDYKISSSSKKKKATDLVIAEIDEIKENYKSDDDYDIEDVEKDIEALDKIGLKGADDDLEEAVKWVDTMKESAQNYKYGKEDYDAGNYKYAAEYLNKVDKEDKNYDDAKDMLDDCAEKLVDGYIEDAQNYLSYDSYQSAYNTLNDAKEEFGDDNDKLNKAIEELESKIVERALEQADKETYTGSKLYYINLAKEVYPENEELKKKEEELVAEGAQSDFDNYIASQFESSYYTAEDIKERVDEYIKNSNSEAYAAKMNELVNEKIAGFKDTITSAMSEGRIVDAINPYSYYSVLASEEDAKEIIDTYGEYLTGKSLNDTDISASKGSLYTSSYYSAPENGREHEKVCELYLGSYSSDKNGTATVSPENYKGITGYVSNKDVNSKGKLVIYADKAVLAKFDINKVGDNAFNCEIPDGTKEIRIVWNHAAGSSADFYLGDVYLTDKYYDASAASGDKKADDKKDDKEKSDDKKDDAKEADEKKTEEETDTAKSEAETDDKADKADDDKAADDKAVDTADANADA